MRSKITLLRHACEGGYPDSFECFSPCRWIPAFAAMTKGKLFPAKSLSPDLSGIGGGWTVAGATSAGGTVAFGTFGVDPGFVFHARDARLVSLPALNLSFLPCPCSSEEPRTPCKTYGFQDRETSAASCWRLFISPAAG